MPNISDIVAPRVPFVNEKGVIAREWYNFLFTLFNLTGGGSSPTSIPDLAVEPSPLGVGEIVDLLDRMNVEPVSTPVASRLDEMLRVLQGVRVAPSSPDAETAKVLQDVRVAPSSPDAVELTRVIQSLRVAPLPVADPDLTAVLQGLSVAPLAPVSTAPLVLTATATLDFPDTVAGAASDLTMTVTGAVSGDVVTLGVPNGSVPANGTFFGWVSAADTVTIRYANNDLVTAYNPSSGTFRAVVTRF